MGDPRIESKAFVKIVNDEVDRILDQDRGGGNTLRTRYNTEKAHANRLQFKDILGPSTEPYWWRLFIDPKDWAAALTEYPGDPGSKYDKDSEEKNQPKAYREGLVRGYNKYLIRNELPEPAGLNADGYIQLWVDVRPGLAPGQKPDTVEKLEFREEDLGAVQFGGPEEFPADVYAEEFTIRSKAAPAGVKYRLLQEGSKKDTFCVIYSDTPYLINTQAIGEVLRLGITAVFSNLQNALRAAVTRADQLRAIARAVRDLHVMHAFTNGCGRTNVHTLLPLLLLRYGFGLSLGGEFGGTVSKKAMYMMFNGGYSIEQIAKWLFVVQDFGLKNLAEGKPSCISPP
ncbi:hypothetical protein F4777DRAFT_42057 [Nemania sp. FL0916]|nr:hypothetical protein F4777DRAFT_42057 [Nemania sp. FL0916]